MKWIPKWNSKFVCAEILKEWKYFASPWKFLSHLKTYVRNLIFPIIQSYLLFYTCKVLYKFLLLQIIIPTAAKSILFTLHRHIGHTGIQFWIKLQAVDSSSTNR